MLHILHSEASPNWGGQERRVLLESLWMRKRGHRLTLLVRRGTILEKKAKETGLEVISTSFTGNGLDFRPL